MYRLLNLFLILSIINLIKSDYRPYRQPWRDYRQRDYNQQHNELYDIEEINHFRNVLGQYNDANDSYERYCYDHLRVSPLIIYDRDKCVIKYKVPLTATLNIDIRIKNNFLRTLVVMDTDDPNFNSFIDVRVLPDMFDFSEAVWSINYGALNVTIPYRVPLGIGYRARCDALNNDIIYVPESQAVQSTSPKPTPDSTASEESTSQESSSSETTAPDSKATKFQYRMLD